VVGGESLELGSVERARDELQGRVLIEEQTLDHPLRGRAEAEQDALPFLHSASSCHGPNRRTGGGPIAEQIDLGDFARHRKY
jgi:hypothetical protein